MRLNILVIVIELLTFGERNLEQVPIGFFVGIYLTIIRRVQHDELISNGKILFDSKCSIEYAKSVDCLENLLMCFCIV